MIRTRDFAVFSAVMVFFVTAITATVAKDLWGQGGQAASVIEFADASAVSGAVTDDHEINRAGNIERLRSKIAAGEGDSPLGAPVFTSVDDVIEDSAPIVTDASGMIPVMIGAAMDGSSLYSDELWRFVGFSQLEQIGTAANGVPIYGARADTLPLDQCGGVDDGSGYKLYLQTNREVAPSCFTNPLSI